MRWQVRFCIQLWIACMVCFFLASPIVSVANSQTSCCQMDGFHQCCCVKQHTTSKDLKSKQKSSGCGMQDCVLMGNLSGVHCLEMGCRIVLPQPKLHLLSSVQLRFDTYDLLQRPHVSVWQPPRF